ncbi:MAG: carbohydrate porin [Rhizobiales bacterium]|nr:carbohydrate porin [Hyphomicrobiales bacterium]
MAGLASAPALAQNVSQAQNTGPSEASIASSLPHNGDPTGLRKWLEQRGATFNVIYTNDVLSNLSGGIKRGTLDQGMVELRVTTDLEQAAGFKDLTLYWNAFQIHNTGYIRRDYAGGTNTIAAIEANATTRLSELWLEKKFLDGRASVRIGQIATDSEFFYSDLSTMFLQSDYPTISAFNQPGGGPAYPLSTPGARLRFDLGKDKGTTLLFAVFNGDPAGRCPGDPDTCNRYGLNFRVRDPALLYGEAQFRSNQGKDDTGLAQSLKIGGWSHLGQFNDQRYDYNGVPLASPASNGVPAKHRGDLGIYGIVDQQLYRPKGGDAASGISVYTRVSLSPSDRNLVDAYIDGGIVFNGLVPKRPDDKFGAAFIYARFSDSVRGFDQDRVNFGTLATPPRDYEANFEFTYVAQVVPGWIIQPVFTYIMHPSGLGIRYPDAKVAGVRSIWKY